MTLQPSSRHAAWRHPRRFVAAITAGVIALGLAACSGTPAADSTGDAIYRIPITDPGTDIDPLTVADYNAMLIAGLASEGLISLDSSGTLVPRLATDWAPSDDGLSWTITVREGANFNDGTPVTAEDVAETFTTITADDSTSPGKSSFDGLVDSVAVGDTDGTVVFTLLRPYSDFPRLLTGANTAILPAGYVPGNWLDNPIGAGQFVLDEYVVGQSATYSKNPEYWDADSIQIDGVELKVYADAQASILALQAGEIDRLTVTSEVLSAIDADQYNTIDSGYNKFDGIFPNQSVAPFDDPTIREALAWAIDRKGLIDSVYNGTADLANDTVYFPDYGVQPEGLEQREQDLDKVAALLDGRTVSFAITTASQLFGEVLQQQLNAVPGFKVTLDVLTDEEYYADSADSPWLNAPLTVTNWAVRGPSEYIGLIFKSDAVWNASHYANPELEAASTAFDATTDDAERQELVNEIAAIQWNDLAVIIPAFSKAQVLQDKRVQGDFPGALDFFTGYSFKGISIT